MKKISYLLWVMAFIVGTGAASAAEFSADMVTQGSGQNMRARIAVKGPKSRLEMPQGIIINRGDLGTAWMVMEGQGMYMEYPLNPKLMSQTSKEIQGETQRTFIGKEIYDGKPADKFQVTYTQQGRTESVYQWILEGELPGKVAAVDGSWSVEFHNIKTSGIDDSLFEIPQGYQKFQVPVYPAAVS